MFFRKSMLLILSLLFLVSSTVTAQRNFINRHHDLGIAMGVLFEGEAYFAYPNKYSAHSSAMMFRVFYDYYLMEKLSVGVYGNFAPTEFPRYDVATMYEFGVTLKPRFMVSPVIAVKPGLNLGYRMYSSGTDIVDMDGLGLNFSCEVQYDIEKTIIPFAEIGFISQPAGGNDITDVTYDPVFYLLGGVVF